MRTLYEDKTIRKDSFWNYPPKKDGKKNLSRKVRRVSKSLIKSNYEKLI